MKEREETVTTAVNCCQLQRRHLVSGYFQLFSQHSSVAAAQDHASFLFPTGGAKAATIKLRPGGQTQLVSFRQES